MTWETRAFKKYPLYLSVSLVCLVLMFRKASNIHFQSKRRYKVVALREVEIPYYRGVGSQRGRGFGALAQVVGRTAIPFLRKYIVPAAKRVCVELLELAVPEIAEVVSGSKNIKTASKSVGRQTLRKQLGEGSRKWRGGSKKRSASRVIPTKSAKQTSRSRGDLFTNISH